jgi:hypothetical protein
VTPPRTRSGDTGDAVRAWQSYLVCHGHPKLKVDGDHGPATEAASVAQDAIDDAARAARADALDLGVRGRIVALARSYVGCSCRTREGRERYLDLVAGPNDTDTAIQQFLTNKSGCAIVCRGLLRKAGYRHHRLESRARI